MTVYIVATLLSCMAAWMAERGSAHRKVWMIVSALPLTLVAAARWGIGTDFDFLYLPQFNAVEWIYGGGGEDLADRLLRPVLERCPRHGIAGSLSDAAAVFWRNFNLEECGYRWLVHGIVSCGGSFRWFIAITSILTGALVFAAIWRQSRWPALAVYLYVATSNYFLSLNIVRQYVAIGFMLFALSFVFDRRPWRFLLLVAVGAMFHKTALLSLPCWFLARIGVGPLWGWGAVLAAIAFSFVAEPVLRFVLPYVGAGFYVRYFDSRFARDGFEWFFFLINFCFMVMGAWYWERATKSNVLVRCWYWMTVTGTVMLSFSATVPLMKRVNYYFAAPQFLMLPELLIAEGNPRVRRWLTVLSVLAFAAETAVAVFWLNKNEPLPYRIST